MSEARDPELQKLLDKYEVHGEIDPYRYVPPGPVAKNFILSDDLSPFIMGPVGGGKTTACIYKRIRAATQMPACRDGVIRCRWVVVRSTFRDAEKTVLASWLASFPKTYPGSSWSGGNDRPAVHTLRFRLANGPIVEATTEFIGLNGQRIEDRLRGFEISGGWVNEADTVDEAGLRYLEQRTGRYPKKEWLPSGVDPYRQVIGDFNAPDIDNWTYATFVEKKTGNEDEKSQNRVLFVQPSGLSPEAENINNLPKGYYEQMAADNPDWFVQRMVHNRFGYSRDGKPVYDTFNPAVHVASKRLIYDPQLPLLIGADGGAGTLKPAAVFAQIHAGWQLRILKEVVPGHGYGPTRFSEMVVAAIEQGFPRIQELMAWGDPSTGRGADTEGGEQTWGEIFGKALGIPLRIPFNGSNEIALRTDAVRAELMTDGTTPNMIIDPYSCPVLIRGFASTYRFKKRTDGSYEPTPDKTSVADDVHNALQYLVGGARGRQAIVQGVRNRARDRQEAGDKPSGWPNGAGVSRGAPAKGGSRGFDPHKVS